MLSDVRDACAFEDHDAKARMWRLHTELVEEPADAQRFASACYTEHGLPLMLALARDNGTAFSATLLDSVNFGGDNVHRVWSPDCYGRRSRVIIARSSDQRKIRSG